MATIYIKQATVGKDPEIKFFNDFAVTSFPVAYTPRLKSKTGEWSDGETVWFRVSVTGKEAESAVERYTKGDRVTVTGELKVSSYIDKAGASKQGLEIRADVVGLIPNVKNKVKTTTQATGDDFEW